MFTVELYAGIRRAVMVDSDLAFIGTRSRRCCSSRFRRVIGGGSGRHRRSSVRTWRGSTRSWKMTEASTRSSAIRRIGFSSGCGPRKGRLCASTWRGRRYALARFVPRHAQADFGQADAYIAGKKVRFHYFCMDLPHSDGCFVKAYPAETAEAFCEGHVAAFDFFGGVPLSILYDNN